MSLLLMFTDVANHASFCHRVTCHKVITGSLSNQLHLRT